MLYKHKYYGTCKTFRTFFLLFFFIRIKSNYARIVMKNQDNVIFEEKFINFTVRKILFNIRV